MDLDERFTMNEEARMETEALECTSCGFKLTRAEAEDPCTIKRFIIGEVYIEDVVCDSCKAELSQIEN